MTAAVSQPADSARLEFSHADDATSVGSMAGKWLVIASVMFNPLLCFLDTKGILHASSSSVALAELLIILAATWYIRRSMSSMAVILSLIISGYVVGAHLINPAASLKILHDLWIPYIFYLLGTAASMVTARKTMNIVMVLVLLFGFFELFAFSTYGQFFNVWKYYVDKGALGADVINYSNTTSFVSGNRGADARTYFPSILGSVRVASVFLEPVSMGNFATIVFAWGLSIWKNKKGERPIILLMLGFLCIILTDSRFATGCCFLMVLIRMTPFVRSSLLVFCMPILIMTVLTMVGSMFEIPGVHPSILVDDLKGRLLFSGRLLDDWGLAPWFAFAASPVYTADTGYAYLCNNLGAPLSVLLFFIFAFHKNGSREAVIMKTMLAVYFATSLCIGANAATIKTGSLVWFLYGVLDTGGRRKGAERATLSGWTNSLKRQPAFR
ncbi:polysaccharide polymerase [Acetobacter conturbans]|uniref:Polysaccharide polymerase n=1 Tax=Acetobacter conturbans TaxID=1737472 RepID=A0ABX0K0Q0_9PROT|nr:polysaccharide polymerase [Acetobacter conturbans]NHN87607.1 polysaccharide polymerase [Acetobacter conturbans]